MKAVEMMKKAIKDSELNGYKWTADKNGLHWSYGVDFNFKAYESGDGVMVYRFRDPRADVQARACTVPDELKEFLDDDLFCEDADTAIYKAAMKIIRRANDFY